MSKKKQHDPVEALKKAFEEQVNDQELQRNYDGFKRNLEYVKSQHNELVPLINANLHSIRSLKDVVLNSAMEGVTALEAVEQIKVLEDKNSEMIEQINAYKEKIDYNKGLIEKYDYLNDHKLFVWWQALKAVDPETKSWIEWKETYKDKII